MRSSNRFDATTGDDLRVLIISGNTRKKNPKTEQSKSACGVLDLIVSWQVSPLSSSWTHRQALTLQSQTDGNWVWRDNAIWFHMPGDNTSAHRCRERREKKSEQPWYDGGKKGSRQRDRGNNSPWCKEQDLRFLPAVLFHLRLTLAAAQSNMPLCWRGRAMGTCFLLFSWPRHWLGMLSWAGGGYSNILGDAKDPLTMQREKKSMWEMGICSLLFISLRWICFACCSGL